MMFCNEDKNCTNSSSKNKDGRPGWLPGLTGRCAYPRPRECRYKVTGDGEVPQFNGQPKANDVGRAPSRIRSRKKLAVAQADEIKAVVCIINKQKMGKEGSEGELRCQINMTSGVVMREKRGLSRVQKLKKRLSYSFGRLAISKDVEDSTNNRGAKLSYGVNGYSEEILDRLTPNGNISSEKYGWDSHQQVHRQLSVSSDSKLLDEDIREETRVILRPKKPPRPKSEVFLNKEQQTKRTKRYSAFGGDSPFGKSEAYIKLEQLGEGSYATVYKGYSNLTNQVVALKEIRLQQAEGAPFTAIREASLLKELKHSNIVTLHDIVHAKETLTFVFEYVHTDLSQYMERHSGGLECRNVRLFLFQLLRGLSYCHRRRVLHRDVKPQNLLISEIGELKLADFGLARAKSVPSHTYSHEVVTLWYRPPDVLLGSTEYSTSLDIWGVGCIFVEMITGVPTFPGIKDTYDQLEKIFKILGTPNEDIWPGVTQLPGYNPHKFGFYTKTKLGLSFPRLYEIREGENMATALLQLNPDDRLGAEEALRHRYFSTLPRKLYELPDEASIFSVEGIRLHPETWSDLEMRRSHSQWPLT